MNDFGLTPEEKLLRLIKGDKPKKDVMRQNDNPAHDNINRKNYLYNNIGKAYKHLTLKAIENIIITTLILSLVYLIICYFYPYYSSKEIKLEKFALNNGNLLAEEKSQIVLEEKTLDSYLKTANRDEVFKQGSFNSSNLALAVATDIAKDLVLVGIISGASPQAVIEDKKAGKTYYVAKGQFIGQYLLEDILEGKIILKSNGQSFELTI